MSVSSVQSSINQVTREISDRERKMSDSYSKESDLTSRINSARSSITKTTSASTAASKMRQIDGWSKDIASEKKKQGTLMKEIADRRSKQLTYQQQLIKAQTDEQKALFRQQDNSIRQQVEQLQQVRISSAVTTFPDKEHDFFISYAHEEKDSIATPLYKALTSGGADVWFDDMMMNVGDSLRKSIDHGLLHSRYGIVILSSSYMTKFWTGQELNGLFQKWAGGHEKVILPIWHNISKDEVFRFSSTLADIMAFKSADFTVDEMATQFLKLIV